MSSPEPKPNNVTVDEDMQKADSKGSAGTAADSSTKDEITSVSQHSRKPPVVGRSLSSRKNVDPLYIKFPSVKVSPGFVDRLYVNLKRLYQL